MPRVKSEDVSEFVGYWLCDNGEIRTQKDDTVLTVYGNGTTRLRHKDGKMKNYQAHRLIAQAFVPQPPGYNIIKFNDGDRANRVASNMSWALSAKPIGAKTLEVLRLSEAGSSSVQVAEILGMTPQAVNRIKKDHKNR
ncbi:hypothetical protein D3C71_448760 [compost metagenome]